MAGFIDGIGVISGVLGIFSFVQDLFPQPETPSSCQYQFRIGLDGTDNFGSPLTEAGGNIPDVRAWNENVNFLGITTNDGSNCVSGSETCSTSVETTNACAYTLFTANTDAICIGWASVKFPGGDQYGNPLGEWAQTCADQGTGGTWAYSNVLVQYEDGTANVKCAWLDSDGDQPTTGIQIHWPEYTPLGNAVQDVSYYCQNGPVLRFRTDNEPSDVLFYTKKRDLFSRDPSYGTSRAQPSPAEHQRKLRDEQYTRMTKRMENDTRLIKSSIPAQTATELCGSPSSASPSFVSLVERKFCFMKTKTVYDFCEDVESGHCWDNEKDEIVAKGDGARLGAVPEVNFQKTLEWDGKA